MSGTVLALGLAAASIGVETAPAPLMNDISIALPAIDGMRGLGGAYERWLPERRLSLAASGELRESAIGDYTGLRIGLGVEVRWYWRASAWRSAQPAGSMVGWFVGGRASASIDATHDRVDHRWLGTALELEGLGVVGYRVAPWRGLEITPSFGLGLREELDLSGRLRRDHRWAMAMGLSAGWMF